MAVFFPMYNLSPNPSFQTNIYEEFSMAVFFQGEIFLQIQVSKHAFMRSFPQQFFQGTIFLQIQVSKHPLLASLQGSQSSLSFAPNYKTQYSAPGDLLIVVSNSSIFFYA